MRPLILWARDHRATLRLAGRSPSEVTGQMMIDGHAVPFHFDLHSFELTLDEGEQRRCMRLDEYGWEIR